MIYNPFMQHTAISNYIDDFKVTINDITDYSKEYSMDIDISVTGIVMRLYVGNNLLTGEISKNFTPSGLINHNSDGIFLAMRKPMTTGSYTKLKINPCVIEFVGKKTEPAVIQTVIHVNKPLNCIMTRDKLTLELLPETRTSYIDTDGLVSINGKGPDSNGNLNIISKSPEILITVEPIDELSKLKENTGA